MSDKDLELEGPEDDKEQTLVAHLVLLNLHDSVQPPKSS